MHLNAETDRVGVMQITDTLACGGSERVALNLANLLPRARFRSYLCTTRQDGSLADRVETDVGRLCLGRKRTLDVRAFRRLLGFIRNKNIRILHAHGYAVLTACMVSRFAPRRAVVWHVHSGRYATEPRWSGLYRLLTKGVNGILAVNEPLADWARVQLNFPAEQIWYFPNFIVKPMVATIANQLPGKPGKRIICVANLRPQKDHLTLIRAMARVVREVPDAHLLLVGKHGEPVDTFDLIMQQIHRKLLEHNVTLLGQCEDIFPLLHACDIGVLSSLSEGLPLALLEYGMAGLPTVATRAGQCAQVLDEGRTGLLVPPQAPDQLADSLLSLLMSSQQRAVFGKHFKRRVQELYSPERVIRQICGVYDTVLRPKCKI